MFFPFMMAGMAILPLLGLAYLFTRFRRFRFVRRLSEKRRWLSWVLPSVPLLIIFAFAFFDLINTVIVVLHLIAFWALFDLTVFLLRKLDHREFKYYWPGGAAVFLTAAYLGFGWYSAHHVSETHYELTTEKDIGMDTLRIVQLSDSHIGNTFDGKGFARQTERIQLTHPDLVVITGDYVDDDTTREDMEISCAALGNLQTTYGVYFVFGNHDRGYYSYRDFTGNDLRAELEKNNVQLLEDETVMIGDQVLLIGRQDKSTRERKSASELMEGVDPEKYTIFLNHQPNDFDAEAKAGIDLVLCGHTHGGQIFPVGLIGTATGLDDKSYGLEARDHTAFIVNSGISCWGLQFKPAAPSEYVVIDIRQVQPVPPYRPQRTRVP